MPWPTFLVLGAPRTGTTALHAALRQHPQIRMSRIKEPNFFAYGEIAALPFQGPSTAMMAARVTQTSTAYQALWAAPPATAAHPSGIVAIGESSMTNFMPRACERIQQYAPTAKLIVILRQPAARAYSQFVHARHHQWEPLADFAAALAAEPERIQQQWIPPLYYTYFGYYAARLAPYVAAFPRQQLRVYRYEAWQKTPQVVLQDIFQFLDVDTTFMPAVNSQLNAGYLPRNPWVHKGLRRLGSCHRWVRAVTRRMEYRLLIQPPPLAPALRQRLMADYRADILQLQILLDQDFSDWFA